jgi:pyruvate dehydrogenase E1 component alpha subunit
VAVAAGVGAALERTDYVFGGHRSHGHYLAKGGNLRRMMAEIFCKADGCAGGRGGSMHLIDLSVGMLGAAPIVAGTISLAVGAAYAAAVRGDGRVSVSFFGDGATGEGVLHESLNLAAVQKLPVVFVCENNLYSTHLPIRECRVNPDIHRLAEPLGIWSRRVDGNDALAVHRAARLAVARCRAGKGPAFIEAMTYRMRGHVGPDDNIQGARTDIRPAKEIAAWKRRDPIARLKRAILRGRVCTAAQLDAADAELTSTVADAIEAARAASFPRPEELSRHVFSGT